MHHRSSAASRQTEDLREVTKERIARASRAPYDSFNFRARRRGIFIATGHTFSLKFLGAAIQVRAGSVFVVVRLRREYDKEGSGMQDVVNYLRGHYSEDALIARPCSACPKRTRGRFRECAYGKTLNRTRCYSCSFEIALAAVRGTLPAIYATRNRDVSQAAPLVGRVTAVQSNA